MLLTPSVAPSEGDRELKETFIHLYGPHAEAIQRYYTNVHVKYSFTHSNQTKHVEGKYNFRNYLLESRSAFGSRSLECRNPRYSFRLHIEDNRVNIMDLTIHDAANEPPLCTLCVPFADPERKLTYLEMAHNEETEFIALRDLIWQNKPVKELQIRFVRIHPVSRKPLRVIQGYFFSPQENWICCGWRSYPPQDPTYVEEVYYYGPQGGEPFPVPRRIEKWIRNVKNPEKSICLIVTEITDFRRASAPFPDTDFTLSAFGLPEPPGLEWKRPTPWYLWVGLAGIVCLALGVGGRWLKQRMTASKR